MPVELVALDLDDTLLDPALRISPRCVEAINEARRHGIVVTLATGRMFQSALPYALQLDMDVPLITYQGALVKNSLSEKVLFYQPVPAETAREIMVFYQQNGVHYHTYYNDRLCMDKLTPEGLSYAKLAGVEAVIMDNIIEASYSHEAIKIMAITENEELLLEMEKTLKERYGERLNITRSKPFFLEAMDKLSNKADALRLTAEHFQINREDVLAIGDSFNDLEMIKWAGTGIAMGNARKIVKEAADFVVSSNEEDGVAEALERFVLT